MPLLAPKNSKKEEEEEEEEKEDDNDEEEEEDDDDNDEEEGGKEDGGERGEQISNSTWTTMSHTQLYWCGHSTSVFGRLAAAGNDGEW